MTGMRMQSMSSVSERKLMQQRKSLACSNISLVVQATDYRVRYLEGYATMEMVVVHPAYWRRGHGTRLVKWGMQLADIDGVKQGVIAASMGKDLYLKLGYRLLHMVQVEGDEDAPDGVYEPQSGER
jgi:GNAT superfamily N-acetyltransferase